MNFATETELNSEQEFSKWTKTQKLAALILLLTPESGSLILKNLDPREQEAVAGEMAKFSNIPQELQAQVLEEFSGVAVEAASSVSCGVGRVQNLLEKSVGLFRASEIVCRVAPMRAPVGAMQQIAELEGSQLLALLRNEQLQTVALVVSFLPPEKASVVLLGLKSELRDQVIERLATLAPASTKAVEIIAEELMRKFGNNQTRALSQTGGIKLAAQVLNALPHQVSDTILVSLTERNSDLGEAVRQKMFTFEELERLDSKTLQRILQAVDVSVLSVALKTASESLKNKLLSCISKRAAETVREEIQFSGALKLRDIEAARNQVISTVRQLESEHEIDLEELRAAPSL